MTGYETATYLMVPAPLITRKALFRKAEYSIKIYGGWELPDNEIIYQAELFISVQGSPNVIAS